jgi:mono/diheme cytochrome c family protein
MKIHPIFIMTAPVMILVSCAQYGASGVPPAPPAQMASNTSVADVGAARTLFLRNCAHCHGADAHGDEGPDLHDLDWTDQQIVTRIQKGKAGQMTAFARKLTDAQINSLAAYVRTLK